jgi:hypothetical protein
LQLSGIGAGKTSLLHFVDNFINIVP